MIKINKVLLIGRLTANPELKYTTSNNAVTTFSIAVDRNFKNEDGNKEADFTPTIINLCNEVGLFTKITFNNEEAKLTIINSDKPDQREEYTSPMRTLELKGCNQIQALGGVETYSRRYLYMSAFDIIENDMFDAQSGSNSSKDVKATDKQIELLKKYYVGDTLEKLLKTNNLEKIEDISLKKASDLIQKIKEAKEKK